MILRKTFRSDLVRMQYNCHCAANRAQLLMMEEGIDVVAGREAKRTMRESASSKSRSESVKVGYLQPQNCQKSQPSISAEYSTHLSLMI